MNYSKNCKISQNLRWWTLGTQYRWWYWEKIQIWKWAFWAWIFAGIQILGWILKMSRIWWNMRCGIWSEINRLISPQIQKLQPQLWWITAYTTLATYSLTNKTTAQTFKSLYHPMAFFQLWKFWPKLLHTRMGPMKGFQQILLRNIIILGL